MKTRNIAVTQKELEHLKAFRDEVVELPGVSEALSEAEEMHDWHDLSVGFFLARGATPNEAMDLAQTLRYTLNYFRAPVVFVEGEKDATKVVPPTEEKSFSGGHETMSEQMRQPGRGTSAPPPDADVQVVRDALDVLRDVLKTYRSKPDYKTKLDRAAFSINKLAWELYTLRGRQADWQRRERASTERARENERRSRALEVSLEQSEKRAAALLVALEDVEVTVRKAVDEAGE